MTIPVKNNMRGSGAKIVTMVRVALSFKTETQSTKELGKTIK